MKLTKSSIRERIGEPSFSRGEAYWRQGRVFNLRRCGDRIEASCAGRRDPYRLWARLDERGIVEAECTCPVGSGGYCKHVAAMLLTWMDAPDEFEETVSLDDRLEALSREQLLLIVRTLLDRDPGLDWALDMVAPAEEPDAETAAVNADSYYHKALMCVPDCPGWRTTPAAVASLEELRDVGDRLYGVGKTAQATAVYRGLVRACVEHYEALEDECQVYMFVSECVDCLADCLPRLAGLGEERKAVMQTLLDVFAFTLSYGGSDLGSAVVGIFQEHATEREREELARNRGETSWQEYTSQA